MVHLYESKDESKKTSALLAAIQPRPGLNVSIEILRMIVSHWYSHRMKNALAYTDSNNQNALQLLAM